MTALALFITGCASTQHREQMGDFDSYWLNGNYQGAAELFVGVDKQEEDLQKLNLFELLHYAEAARLSGELETAVQAYDASEEFFKRFDEKNLAAKAAGTAGSLLINDSVRAYQGTLYEAVLSNAYKSLSFLALGQGDMARVELNRADDRTRRAVEYFSSEIERQQEELAQEEKEKDEAKVIAQTIEKDEFTSSLNDGYGDINQWAVYPSYVNPFVTYLHAIYFASSEASGDLERASDSLKRVAGMVENSYVQNDLSFVESILTGETRDPARPKIRIIYEQGTGPFLEEKRFDVPLFLVSGSVAYTGIAIPDMDSGSPAADMIYAEFTGPDGQPMRLQSEPLADMEMVARTEFKGQFKGIVTRAVASAAVKALIQAEASNQLGVWGQIAGGVFAAATTQADLRSWRAAPYRWDLISFDRPADGRLHLRSNNGALYHETNLPEWNNTLIYVKQPSSLARPSLFVLDLSGAQPAWTDSPALANSD
ncbi:MAG: hypothetical protein RQ729_08785 [Wenzhouxiangellaceae bacterium]|nr:hypothetical protein [Wenzhouxiangellaceae bacterium]